MGCRSCSNTNHFRDSDTEQEILLRFMVFVCVWGGGGEGTEASFRVADERGWEPMHEPIYGEDGKLSARRRTKLPIGKIVRKIQHQQFPVALSSVLGSISI